jgi:hypothetical protein
MKKNLELCVYISDINHLINLNETFRPISKPNPELYELLDINLKANISSIPKLSEYFHQNQSINLKDDVERVYFGQETCENLIPTLKDVTEAFEYCRKQDLKFTYVTPYIGPKAGQQLESIFEFLNNQDEESEIVVNDFGVLQLLFTKYQNLIPTLGRLLIKLKRDPRFSLSGYDIAQSELSNSKKVEKNQAEALHSSSMDIPVYQQLLKDKGVKRIGIDTLPQGVDSKVIKRWGFPVDLYWPWVYITSGRNCTVAAYTQPGKTFHPTDEMCRFQCKQIQLSFTSDKRMLASIQKGNAVWMNCESLYKDFFDAGFDRLIYQPYIPI